MPFLPSPLASGRIASVAMVAVIAVLAAAPEATSAVDKDLFCATTLMRASHSFSRCLGSSQQRVLRRPSDPVDVSRVARCEALLRSTLERIEARALRRSWTCADTASFESIRVHDLAQANSRARLLGVADRATVNATPGSDTLVLMYPYYTFTGTAMKDKAVGVQLKYNNQLAARNFSDLTGFLIPIVGYKPAAKSTYCPYLDDPDNGYTYHSQMKTLRKDTGTSTLIGVVSVGQYEDWSGSTPSGLTDCLGNFVSEIGGVLIDDEWNVLTAPKRAAIMDWCNGQSTLKRCGFFIGHGGTSIQYTGAMQNTCMAYNSGAVGVCNGEQTRNIYKNGIAQPPLFDPALNFDILN